MPALQTQPDFTMVWFGFRLGQLSSVCRPADVLTADHISLTVRLTIQLGDQAVRVAPLDLDDHFKQRILSAVRSIDTFSNSVMVANSQLSWKAYCGHVLGTIDDLAGAIADCGDVALRSEFRIGFMLGYSRWQMIIDSDCSQEELDRARSSSVSRPADAANAGAGLETESSPQLTGSHEVGSNSDALRRQLVRMGSWSWAFDSCEDLQQQLRRMGFLTLLNTIRGLSRLRLDYVTAMRNNDQPSQYPWPWQGWTAIEDGLERQMVSGSGESEPEYERGYLGILLGQDEKVPVRREGYESGIRLSRQGFRILKRFSDAEDAFTPRSDFTSRWDEFGSRTCQHPDAALDTALCTLRRSIGPLQLGLEPQEGQEMAWRLEEPRTHHEG